MSESKTAAPAAPSPAREVHRFGLADGVAATEHIKALKPKIEAGYLSPSGVAKVLTGKLGKPVTVQNVRSVMAGLGIKFSGHSAVERIALLETRVLELESPPKEHAEKKAA